MDIKERIQDLTLDQKAKLYFMGLLRKGVIDTLPEDPKAAYIRDMMDKENPRMDPAIRSDFDDPTLENLKEIATKLGYLKEGIPQGSEIADYVEAMFNDSVVEKEGFQSDIWTKEEYAATSRDEGSVFMDLAKHLNSVGGKDVLEGNPDIHLELLSNGDIQWSADVTLNENLNEAQMPEKITFSYTDPGFSFYSMYYLINNDRKKLSSPMEATKFINNLGVDGDVPRRYNETELDKIVRQLEAKGIEADHNAFMDVS